MYFALELLQQSVLSPQHHVVEVFGLPQGVTLVVLLFA
jgi:hypothetical protein